MSEFTVRLVGRDEIGYVAQIDGWDHRYYLTDCCGASAKGVERGVACRSCYRLIDPMLGGTLSLEEPLLVTYTNGETFDSLHPDRAAARDQERAEAKARTDALMKERFPNGIKFVKVEDPKPITITDTDGNVLSVVAGEAFQAEPAPAPPITGRCLRPGLWRFGNLTASRDYENGGWIVTDTAATKTLHRAPTLDDARRWIRGQA